MLLLLVHSAKDNGAFLRRRAQILTATAKACNVSQLSESACSSADRVLASGAKGLEFESPQARQLFVRGRRRCVLRVFGFFLLERVGVLKLKMLNIQGERDGFDMVVNAKCLTEETSQDGSTVRVRMEPCTFHPAGGGQPGDTGVVFLDDTKIPVLDTLKDERGTWIVIAKEWKGRLADASVKYEVDEARHSLLSRMHSGEHVLSRILEKKHPGLKIYKVNVGTEETSVYIHYDGILDWPILFKAEEEGNEIVRNNLPVRIEHHTRDTAQKIPDLKINWERIGNQAVRVVRMGEFDAIACSGSHVGETGDIGKIFITGYNGSAPDWVFRFTVEGETLAGEYLRQMRSLLRAVGCSAGELEGVFSRAQEEKKELARTIERMMPLVQFQWRGASDCDGSFRWAVMPGIPREVASHAVRRMIQEDHAAVCLVLLPENEGPRGGFLLAHGAGVDINLADFVRNTKTLDSRGGGKPDWVNGTTTVMDPNIWENAYRDFKG